MVRSLIPLVIAGPTASGKSDVALQLALLEDGEIICADSRQFYAGMAIGTASPSDADKEQVKHHGYQTVDPSTRIDAGYFVDFAKECVRDIQRRNKRPILVGGTGLYLRALRYGLAQVPKSAPGILEQLERECEAQGLGVLYRELERRDPESARAIAATDRYRIIRAVEICRSTNKKASELRSNFSGPPSFDAQWQLLMPDRQELIAKLESRVAKMFGGGLLEEAKLLKDILPRDHWALDVMGYREALLCLDGKVSQSQAIELTLCRHRQYAKRQYTWFAKETFYSRDVKVSCGNFPL